MNCKKNTSWLMKICCLLPIIAIIILPLIGVKSAYLNVLAFLACPLAMLFMMLMNKDKNKKCH